MPHRIGIVGFGKIAQDQHLPVIMKNSAFELAGVVSPREPVPNGIRRFTDHRAMLSDLHDLDAVAVCTPPSVRHGIARDALLAGKHVLLEKPPAATLSEFADLERVATDRRCVLYATWHSRHAPAIEEARRRLAGKSIRAMSIAWKEDVRRWHPGQTWIWEAGGFGVFDPGINALSIVTYILPMSLVVRRAELAFPSNRDAPIAAAIDFGPGNDLRAAFDWRQTGDQIWQIEIATGDGIHLKLADGGARLEVDGRPVTDEPAAEYEAIYVHFDELLRHGRSDVDAAPFRLVADAFMIGKRVQVEPFDG